MAERKGVGVRIPGRMSGACVLHASVPAGSIAGPQVLLRGSITWACANIIEAGFNFENFDAIKFTKQHDLYHQY